MTTPRPIVAADTALEFRYLCLLRDKETLLRGMEVHEPKKAKKVMQLALKHLDSSLLEVSLNLGQ